MGKKCKHLFDGGECLNCGEKSLCELCDENPWETRCDQCDKGRICDDCHVTCKKCGNFVCTPCGPLTNGLCEDCINELPCEICKKTRWTNTCKTCGEYICENCLEWCKKCSRIVCNNCKEYLTNNLCRDCIKEFPVKTKEMISTVESTTQLDFINSEYSWKNMSLQQYLDEGNSPPGWEEFFNMPNIKKILETVSGDLDTERGMNTIYPPINQVFRAFYMTPLDKVKVVLLAQDPYHNGSAVGLCFSVKPGNEINPSLKNIYRELRNEGFTPKENGDLTNWAKQGVLLLNTALTVEKGHSESHLCFWAEFTNELIKYIGKKLGNKVQWLLFGKPAFAVVTKNLGRTDNMLITTHPSPLGATRDASFGPAFIGSGVFSQIDGIKW
jgi:uracil-DNA glycosylase